MMFANINMNDVPVTAGKVKDFNPHMFVGEYNAFEDPVISEFVNEWVEFFKVFVCTVAVYIAYTIVLCLFGWSVTTIWPFIQEWIEIICMISSISVTAMFLKWIHDENEETDSYIVKLKTELAAKNAIIAELEIKLDSVSDSKSETDSLNSDDDNDSDYDPELDEY